MSGPRPRINFTEVGEMLEALSHRPMNPLTEWESNYVTQMYDLYSRRPALLT